MQEKALDWRGLKIDTLLPIDAQSLLEGITISLSGFLYEKQEKMTNLNIFPIHKTWTERFPKDAPC